MGIYRNTAIIFFLMHSLCFAEPMLLLIGNKDVPLNISQEKERDVLYKGDILTILPFNYEPTRAEIDTYIFIEVDLTPEEIDALLTPLLEDQLLLEEEHLTGQVFPRKAKRRSEE